MIERIIDEYYTRVYAFTLVHVKSKAMARDLTQDIFMQLVGRQSKLSEIDNLESYVFAMARNTVYRNYRKIQQSQELKAEMLRNMSKCIPDCIVQIEGSETERYMYNIIDQLPARQKEIFLLSREKGLTHKEIAEKLNISPNTVKNHLVQALKTLRTGFELLKFWVPLVGIWFM